MWSLWGAFPGHGAKDAGKPGNVVYAALPTGSGANDDASHAMRIRFAAHCSGILNNLCSCTLYPRAQGPVNVTPRRRRKRSSKLGINDISMISHLFIFQMHSLIFFATLYSLHQDAPRIALDLRCMAWPSGCLHLRLSSQLPGAEMNSFWYI